MPAPPRVLVVDDEVIILEIAGRVLEREGYEVVRATTGEGALAAMAEHQDIALVLLDASLPDINAERVLELMRERGIATPVLLSSGYSSGVPGTESFANVVGFLGKPYSVRALGTRVRELVSPD